MKGGRISACALKPFMGWRTHPFGAKSNARISLTWPSSTIAVRPVRRSQTRPIASQPLNVVVIVSAPIRKYFQCNDQLTQMPPMLRHPGMPARTPHESDLPVLVIPFSSRHPKTARCHRKTPIRRNSLMDGTLHALLWPRARITSPKTFHCDRGGLSISCIARDLACKLTFLETTT